MSLNLQRNLSFDYLSLVFNDKKINVTSLLCPGICGDKEGVSGIARQRSYYIVAASNAADELLL